MSEGAFVLWGICLGVLVRGGGRLSYLRDSVSTVVHHNCCVSVTALCSFLAAVLFLFCLIHCFNPVSCHLIHCPYVQVVCFYILLDVVSPFSLAFLYL